MLTRPWKIAPGLVARRKLRRQGSKFIECYRDNYVAPIPRAGRALMAMFMSDRKGEESPAFRIYAFKKGAWPEMILGAVMGAAGRIEAERRQQQQATPAVEEIAEVRSEFERSYRRPADGARAGVELPGLDPDLMVRRRTRPNIFKHRPGAVHEPVDRRRHTLPMGPSFEERRREPVTRTADATADRPIAQRFGNYAGSRRGRADDLPRSR